MNIKTKIAAASIMACMFNSNKVLACDAYPMLAEVCPVAFNFAPRGWALAQGQLLSISQNQSLFSLLGTNFGGDGRTTFGLPDTRSRVVVGAATFQEVGEKGGLENVTLTMNEMPAHSHAVTTTVTSASTTITVVADLKGYNGRANNSSPENNNIAQSPGSNRTFKAYDANAPQVAMHVDSVDYALDLPLEPSSTASVSLSNAGNSSSHSNIQPVLGMYWVIALQGVFPSRN